MDGVAASELTSLVPQALAGSHVHRGLVGPFSSVCCAMVREKGMWWFLTAQSQQS